MRQLITHNFLLFIMLSWGFLASAQDNRLSASATVGAASPILDNGLGVHLGVNPYLRLTAKLSAEGQLSYLYTRIGSSFLSGNTGNGHAINTLAGLRFYLSGENKKNRFYLNLLLGLNYQRETENGIRRDGELNMGFSVGGYYEIKKLLIGLSYDTPQHIVLKIGYLF